MQHYFCSRDLLYRPFLAPSCLPSVEGATSRMTKALFVYLANNVRSLSESFNGAGFHLAASQLCPCSVSRGLPITGGILQCNRIQFEKSCNLIGQVSSIERYIVQSKAQRDIYYTGNNSFR